MTHLELLAPARDIGIGIAAIDCGADAVYIAGPSFGARQAAGNSVEDIRKLCDYAHRFGAKIFVTLNTILRDDEIEDAFTLALELQEAGIDALIVQDLSLLSLMPRLRIPLHASTQCSIQDAAKAVLYEKLGFSRLVLERELPLSAVSEIRSAVSCELECFVHGALCVCYSGQCYLSEMLCGRSANRGSCVQACRSRYDLVDGSGRVVRDDRGRALAEGKTPLSLKDLNLSGRIEDLVQSGVCSFKIEGRLKNISYVRNTVSAYSQAIDAVIRKHPGKYDRLSFGRSECKFVPNLDKTFNRFYTELNIDGKRGHWACLDAGKSLGEPVGIVVYASCRNNGKSRNPRQYHSAGPQQRDSNFRITLKPAEGQTSVPALHNGDGFSFIGIGGEDCGFRADICCGNEIICSDNETLRKLRPGTVIYRNLDIAFEKELAKSAVRSIGAEVTLKFGRSEADIFTVEANAVSEDGRTVALTDEFTAEPASNTERMRELLHSQISKNSGIYRFSLTTLHSADGVLPMMQASRINDIRRRLADLLDRQPVHCNLLMNRSSGKNVLDSESDADIFRTLPPDAVPSTVSYKYDVANSIAEDIWHKIGARNVEPAYELSHAAGVELMRTKYCIRYELGLCKRCSPNDEAKGRKPETGGQIPEKLFLRNNGRVLELRFDCRHCEMTVHEV